MKYFVRYAFAVLLIVFAAGCGKKTTAADVDAITVRTEKPSVFQFQDKIATQGVVEPVDQAVLSTLIPGKIEKLKVKEGDHFRKGEELFASDQENLKNRCTLAEEALKMAKERLHTREADLEMAKVTFEKANLDFERSKALYGGKAVSKSSHESAELKYRTGLLAVRQAKASVTTAKAEVSFAQATLDIARKRLSDSSVIAPYDGVITAKLRHENEFCNVGTPVLKIERRPGKKRLTAAVSAVRYPGFAVGKTQAVLSFRNREMCRVPVTIVSPVIDPASRTFEVKADLPDSAQIPSGMLCDVAFVLGERKNLSLPEDAILFRKDGKFAVFAVDKGKAIEIPVTTGVTQDGRTELMNGNVLKDRDVIVSGQYFVNPGTPVTVSKK